MSPSRQGVALIIAISVLAALLFLALPFVFSQSASVAGARAAAWDGSARRGSDRSAGLASAMAIYATGLHRSPTLVAQLSVAQQTYVQLPLQINDGTGAIRYPSFIDNSWRLVLDSAGGWTTNAGVLAGLDNRDAVHGAVIEDESRRVDPNTLGERAWAIVLARANIRDPHTVAWSWNGGDSSLPANNPLRYGTWRQLNYGRLANRLADFRPSNGHRYNRLEDLLGADPNETVSDPPPPFTLGCEHITPQGFNRRTAQPVWPIALGASWPQARDRIEATRNPVGEAGDGYRVAPLTQAELEQLRPLISFLVPGQGRSGLIDVGTVVQSAPDSNGWDGVTTDELSPHDTGVGPDLRMHDSSRVLRVRPSNGHIGTGRYIGANWAVSGDVLAMESAPTLNINTVPGNSAMVALYSSDPVSGTPPTVPGWPADPVLTPVTSIGGIGRLLWLDPRAGGGQSDTNTWFERPALGILGFGIVAIEGAATARDREGGATAQRRRRTIVQAVPQERPVEAAWRTQGELEALVRGRHGSWIQAGPHPTSRVADWGATAGDMAALDGAGWLEPAPLVSFARSAAVTFDWRAPFGLGTAQRWEDVLKDQNGNGGLQNNAVVLPTQVGPSGVRVGALTAQGLRLQGGGLAYTTSDSAGPLRFIDSRLDELGVRHVSMRFCLPAGAGAGAVITLIEVRNQRDPTAGATAAANTNLWRVEYRRDSEQLVLVIANAALPWTAADRTATLGVDWTAGNDDDPGADADPRCAPGAYPFAPADPATRVEFRYAVPGGLAAGQWYHLQSFCASDRPGMHGLTLDGVVGRDATRPGVDMARLGDHYTWPSLRIVNAIAPSQPATSGGAALLSTTSLSVQYPAGIALADILPPRGFLRIDDEYFSYTGLVGSAGPSTGTGTINGVQRARRVNTNQAATVLDPADTTPPIDSQLPDADLRWPVTQQHVAGTLATPGWSQVDRINGRWLRGHGALKQLFGPQSVRGFTTSVSQLPVTGDTITIPPTTGPTPGSSQWPAHGIVRLDCLRSGGADPIVAFAAFDAAGSDLTLGWGGNGVTASVPPQNDIIRIDATLVSLQVDGAVTDTDVTGDGVDDLLWGDAVQLLDLDDGRCEWVAINDRADRATETIGAGRFLIESTGWNMVPYTSPNQPYPIAQPRGNTRTGVRPDDWRIDRTLILPVQTSFDMDRLEAGDVVTLVPDAVTFGSNEPARLLVRYAARDAYPTPATASTLATGARYDTRNERFALAHPVPSTLGDPSAVPQSALIGRGWAGDDLSMVGNRRSRLGAMPRQVLVGGTNARVFFGSADPRTGGAQDVVIDDLCAGRLPGPSDVNSATGCSIIAINGSSSGSIAATAAALPAEVTASQAVFQAVNNQTYGLCQIDGEAFAYRRIDDDSAVLIARALLGTEMAVHALGPDPATRVVASTGTPRAYRDVRASLPIVRLPLGPVGELCTALAVADHGKPLDLVEIPFSSYYRDPPASGFGNAYQTVYAARGNQRLDDAAFVLINDPAGAVPPEVLRLLDHPTQANQVITGNWLRGLYGTSARAWSAPYNAPASRPTDWIDQDTTPYVPTPVTQGAGQLNPIVIAWWPRFAPGLRNASGLSTAEQSALLRSRTFAWAGFPLRLHGMRIDPTIPVLNAANGGLANLPVAAEADCDLELRAQAAGDGADELFDWELSPVHSLGSGANTITAAPFSTWPSNRFAGREVDGAEMRVHWSPQLASGLSGLAAAVDIQGRAPRLGASDTEAQALPVTDAGVRLRCVAPARVLAVEEVR